MYFPFVGCLCFTRNSTITITASPSPRASRIPIVIPTMAPVERLLVPAVVGLDGIIVVDVPAPSIVVTVIDLAD